MFVVDVAMLFFTLGNTSGSDTGAFYNVNAVPALRAMEAGATRFNMCVSDCAKTTCVRFSPSDGSCLQKGYNNGCTRLLPGAANPKQVTTQYDRHDSFFRGDTVRTDTTDGAQGCAHPGSVTCVPAVCFNQLPVLRVGCAQTATAANRTDCSPLLNGPNLSPPPVLGATSFGGYVWNGARLVADNVALRVSWLSGPARHIEHAFETAKKFGAGSGYSPYEVVSLLMGSTVYTTSATNNGPVSFLSTNLKHRHPNSTAVLDTLASIPVYHFLHVL